MVKEIINMCVMEGDTYMRMDIIKKRYKLKVSSSNTCFIHIGRYEVAEGNFGWIQLSYHRILPILFFFFFFISNAFLTDFLLKDEKVLERKKLDFPLKETIQRQSKACKIVSAFCPELIDEWISNWLACSLNLIRIVTHY